MKKVLKNIILCYFIVSLIAVCFATDPGYNPGGDTGNTREPTDNNPESWAKDEQRYVHTQPYDGGTGFTITHPDENGNPVTNTFYLDAGVGCGGMTGKNSDTMKNGVPEIPKEDIVATLRQIGTPEALAAADAIENDSEYRMLAQQFIYVYDKKTRYDKSDDHG